MTDRRSEEHFVHRIEAFSDVVIGFTLAQVGAALVQPVHAANLTTNWGWLFTFSWTFAIVCLMWWMHNRVFRTVFVPTRLSLLVNFALLAAIVLLLYFAEAVAHAAALSDLVIAQRLYNAALGTAFGFAALLSFLGARARSKELSVEYMGRAMYSTVLIGTAAFFVITIDVLTLLRGDDPWVPAYLGLSIPLAFLVGRSIASATGYKKQ